MNIRRAYRTELDPTKAQIDQFHTCCEVRRVVYNWAIRRKEESRMLNELPNPHKVPHPNFMALGRELTKLRSGRYGWMTAGPRTVETYALRDADEAFKRFFKNCREGISPPGYPRFKSRRNPHRSFSLNDIRVEETRVRLPILGWVRLKETAYLQPLIEGQRKLHRTTVSERGGRWFISVSAEEDVEMAEGVPEGETVGLDIGINYLGVLSDGTRFENPRGLERIWRKKLRLQKSLSRKERGSNNRARARVKLARLEARAADIRREAIHRMTTEIVRSYQTIIIEDLDVRGMTVCKSCEVGAGVCDGEGFRHDPRFRQALSDAAFYEIRRQLEYKSRWYGRELIVADRFFASSQICSSCGHRQPMPLSVRLYACPKCHSEIDRDLNAAINLSRFAAKSVENENGSCVDREVHA